MFPAQLIRSGFQPVEQTEAQIGAGVMLTAATMQFSDPDQLRHVLESVRPLVKTLLSAGLLSQVQIVSDDVIVPLLVDYYPPDPDAEPVLMLDNLRLLEIQAASLELRYVVRDRGHADALGAGALPNLGSPRITIVVAAEPPEGDEGLL